MFTKVTFREFAQNSSDFCIEIDNILSNDVLEQVFIKKKKKKQWEMYREFLVLRHWLQNDKIVIIRVFIFKKSFDE